MPRLRSQKRIPGVKRVWAGGSLHPDVEKLVKADMRRFRASRSFVLATLVTAHYEDTEKRRFGVEHFDE